MTTSKDRKPASWLLAMGKDDLPGTLQISDTTYRLIRTFKHDFFAATGLYADDSGTHKVVLKVGRVAPALIPLSWIGRFLAKREARLLMATQHLDGVPDFLGMWQRTGIIHAFIEGHPLKKDAELPDDFFPRLEQLIADMHALGIAYVDLEKRENVLVGDDGKPWLFDFQIAWDRNRSPISRWLRRVLQKSDIYHLGKHWKRLRPDQLDDAKLAELTKPPFWIAWHRRLIRPLILIRRRVLVWLGARDTAKGRSPG